MNIKKKQEESSNKVYYFTYINGTKYFSNEQHTKSIKLQEQTADEIPDFETQPSLEEAK